MGGMKKVPKVPVAEYVKSVGSEMDTVLQGEVARRRAFGGVPVPLKDVKKPKGGKKK